MHLTIPSTTTDCPGGHWCPDPVREEISQDTIRRLIRSMPKHCWECIQARGGHIHYWVTLRVAVILFTLVGVACDFNYLSCLSCYAPYSGSTATLFFFFVSSCVYDCSNRPVCMQHFICAPKYFPPTHTHMWILQTHVLFLNSHTELLHLCLCVCVVLNMSHFLPHMLLWITPPSREYGLSPPPFPPSSMPFPHVFSCEALESVWSCVRRGGWGDGKRRWLLDWCLRVWVWVPLPLGRKWWENAL